MNTSLGLAHVWSQGDAITRGVALILLSMSIASWIVMLGKLTAHWRYKTSTENALNQFWSAPNNVEALRIIQQKDRFGAFSVMATEAITAATSYDQNATKGIGALADKNEFIARTLQQSIVAAQTRVESGLTFLASIGATAPFVGLLGTVWGIYHALVGLSGVRQVGLDQVAGPVGEALIMTAAGLFVAIPAVLAYNACARSNRLVTARLDGFAHSLHNYLVGGMRTVSIHSASNANLSNRT